MATPLPIDVLPVSRGLIDLNSHSSGDFGLDDQRLTFLFDDIVLVELADLSEDGDNIMRNGLLVPTNALTKAWRKGKVILVGPHVKYAKVNDVVIFPNNMGISISNLEVGVDGVKVKKGMFLNEARMFGICQPSTKAAVNAGE